MRYLGKICSLAFCLILSACQTNQYVSVDKPTPPGYTKKLVTAGDFVITTYQKISDKNKPIVYYLEGDGRVADRFGISRDPTPRQDTLVALMKLDSRPNVIYVARPCQYTPKNLNPKCYNNKYWTSRRFSQESVDVLDQVMTTTNISGKKFSIVGYSGGGGLAVLIANQNQMVSDIVTIGGNLDSELFTEYHRSVPMDESLNPINYAVNISHIPQLHLGGELDRIVPPEIAQKFVALASSDQVKVKILPGVTHSRGWKEFWQPQMDRLKRN